MSPLAYLNLAVFSSGLFPLFILIFIYKLVSPRYHGLWIFGMTFIAISGLLAGSLLLLKKFYAENIATFEGVDVANFGLELWLYIVPAVIAAIGVNLITEYILKNKASLK